MSPIRMSKVEAALRMTLNFIDGFNHHDVEGMTNLICVDCLFESSFPAPDGKKYSGNEEIASYWKDLFARIPSLTILVEDSIGFGNKCIVTVKYSWIDREEKKNYLRGALIIQLRDGRIGQLLSYIKG